MKKRMLALLVCAALVLALLPATALADDADYVMDFSKSVGVLWMGGGNPHNFSQSDYKAEFWHGDGTKSKWTWAHETKTLTLQDITFTTTANIGIKLPAGSTLVLEGTNSVTANGGKAALNAAICVDEATTGDLTIKGEGSLTATGGGATNADSCGIYVYDGAITFENADVTATGGTVTAAVESGSTNVLDVRSCGVCCYPEDITVESGTLNATGGTVTASTAYTVAFSYGINGNAIVINGGTVTANGGEGIVTSGVEDGYAVSEGITSDDIVRVNGGTLTATGEDSGIDTNIFELRGGSVVATGEDTDSDGIYAYNASTNDANQVITFLPGKVSVFAGTLTAEGGESGIYSTLVSVSGGKVEITANDSDGYGIMAFDMSNGEDGVFETSSVTVSGGSVKCTGKKFGIYSESGITVTGGTLYATGGYWAVFKFTAKPTNVTATGSDTYKDPISKLGAVKWDGDYMKVTSKNSRKLTEEVTGSYPGCKIEASSFRRPNP